MKDPELHKKVLQTLNEFETMENIQQSEEWNKSLMERLATVKADSPSVFSYVKYTIAALLVILINIGFILTAINNDPHQTLQKDIELQIISKELLINSNSVNN